MKKLIVCLFLMAFALPALAQRGGGIDGGTVETDIFGDLKYETRDRGYTATLKKDVFGGLLFSDSRRNRVEFDKKYLDREYPGVTERMTSKFDFFNVLIRQYRTLDRQDAVFRLDVFGGGRNSASPASRPTVSRDAHGILQYRSGSASASLGQSIYGPWVYTDSGGNKFEFSDKTWRSLMLEFGSDDKVFLYLIEEFLR